MGKCVMIMAGGTGGHIFPALAVAEKLREDGCEVRWLGTRKGMEAKIVPAAGFPIDWLSVTGLRGKGVVHKIKAPFMVLLACMQAVQILVQRKPDIVLGMGGFVAGPGGLMAYILRLPLVIHEQNRIPGTTNRLLFRLAKVVMEAFPGSFHKHKKVKFTGNPLRNSISTMFESVKNPDTKKVRILVLGGSQGALVLNQVVPAALRSLTDRVQVCHQTGASTVSETISSYSKASVQAEVVAFIDDMAEVYGWADLVICRAGAMTVSELAAAGLPSILVPYPHAIDDHQTWNARYLEEVGAAVIVTQAELSATVLETVVVRLIEDTSVLTEMSKAARSLARLDATQQVVAICHEEAR